MTARRREAVLASGLATALLAGPWQRPPMVRRVAVAIGRPRAPRWAGTLVGEVLDAYRDPPRDRPRELAGFLRTTRGWHEAQRATPPVRVVRWQPAATAVRPRSSVPGLPDLAALARLLDVDAGELAWFADARSLERTVAEPLRHYRWRVVPRPDGVRVLAAPKPRLKEIQRRLLRHVLAPVPVHEAAHGCVPGRSVRTAAAPHARTAVVLRLDLESFFAGIAAGRVHGVLLTVPGLPEPVAHAVTGLVTTVAPAAVWRQVPVPAGDGDRHYRLGRRLAAPHLPVGAPTSAALANLVAFRLDRRLAGLAAAAGTRYTRYVDDLTFSGGPELARPAFARLVTAVAAEEVFRVNPRKTSATGASARQSVLGTVVNERPTLPRPERDALRALLHNCATRGWATQTRGHDPATFRDHVLGRVARAASVDPVLGARLRELTGRIDWGPPA